MAKPIGGGLPWKASPTITPGASDQDLFGQYYHATVKGDPDLVAGNIKNAIDLFGVTGSLDPNLQVGDYFALADITEQPGVGATNVSLTSTNWMFGALKWSTQTNLKVLAEATPSDVSPGDLYDYDAGTVIRSPAQGVQNYRAESNPLATYTIPANNRLQVYPPGSAMYFGVTR